MIIELKSALEHAIVVVNYINTTKARLSKELWIDMRDERMVLLYYCSLWCVHFEMSYFAHLTYIKKFVFFTIFDELNNLNLFLQSSNMHIIKLLEKIATFKKTLKLWIKADWIVLEILFRRIYLDPKSFLCTSFTRIYLNFLATAALNQDLVECWILIQNEYPKLSSKAILIPFAVSHLCVAGFSASPVWKSKYRLKINVEQEMRAALWNFIPRLKKKCENHQNILK